MSARWRAILIAALSAAAALLLPPLTSPLAYVGAAVVGLVTLRLGAVEGFGVLAVAAVALAAVGAVLGGVALPLASGALVLWLPVWVLALLLRYSRSLALMLQAAALLGLMLVLLAHLWLGDPAAWWAPRLEAILGPLFAAQNLDVGDYLPNLARWMTALTAAAVVLGVSLSLLWARSWQAGLYNPGGFGAEFRALRLGRPFAAAVLAVVVTAQLPAGPAAIAADVLFTLVVVYLLQGLALAHAAVQLLQARRGWLVGLYGLLLFAAPQLVVLLALAGWLDAWIDVRSRLRGRG